MSEEYDDGYAAARRTGKYEGSLHMPANPHKQGTLKWADWHEGACAGTLDEINKIRAEAFG